MSTEQSMTTERLTELLAELAARIAEARPPAPFRVNEWCDSPDHHQWLHMLLDRAKKDLSDAYVVIARQGAAMRDAGVTLDRE